MVGILAEDIHDNRFLRLVRNMLQAGYLEDWIWGATLSGAPQGGVVSPILSNIYLHRLDYFVERILIPQYTAGKYGNSASGSARCRAWIRKIRDTGGCVISDMPTTICSGLPDRKLRPRRSRRAWPGSCEKTSSWN